MYSLRYKMQIARTRLKNKLLTLDYNRLGLMNSAAFGIAPTLSLMFCSYGADTCELISRTYCAYELMVPIAV